MSFRNSIDPGWKEEDGKLLPILVLLFPARDVFQLDVKCTCKAGFQVQTVCVDLKRLDKYLSTTPHFCKNAPFLAPLVVYGKHICSSFFWFMANIYVIPYSEPMHATYVQGFSFETGHFWPV